MWAARSFAVVALAATAACGRVRFDEASDASVDTGPVCDPVFVPVVGAPHRYLFGSTTGVDWLTAKASCEAFGPGHGLSLPRDDAERTTLFDQVDSIVQTRWWLGGSDRDAEGTFVDVTGAPIAYLPWAPGEPNDFNGEDCLALHTDPAQGMARLGRFDDRACTATVFYICACVLP